MAWKKGVMATAHPHTPFQCECPPGADSHFGGVAYVGLLRPPFSALLSRGRNDPGTPGNDPYFYWKWPPIWSSHISNDSVHNLFNVKNSILEASKRLIVLTERPKLHSHRGGGWPLDWMTRGGIRPARPWTHEKHPKHVFPRLNLHP